MIKLSNIILGDIFNYGLDHNYKCVCKESSYIIVISLFNYSFTKIYTVDNNEYVNIVKNQGVEKIYELLKYMLDDEYVVMYKLHKVYHFYIYSKNNLSISTMRTGYTIDYDDNKYLNYFDIYKRIIIENE